MSKNRRHQNAIINHFYEHAIQFAVLLLFVVIVWWAALIHRFEAWTFFESLYFSVITMSTIWYGDFVPMTDAGKTLAMIYALTGVPMFLVIVTIVLESRIKRVVWNHFIKYQKEMKEAEKELKETEIITAKQEQDIKKIKKEIEEKVSKQWIFKRMFGRK